MSAGAFPEVISNAWLGFQFRLRSRVLGRIPLRPGLPGPKQLGRSTSRKELEFYRLLLETGFGDRGGDLGCVIDVGCRNGSYLPSLSRFFPNAEIIGNELDPWRRYWNLWRRGDFARAHAISLPRGRFVPGDFRKSVGAHTLPRISGSALGFTFFYPFVSQGPCRGWGLPSGFCDFSDLLAHARSLARDMGSDSWIVSAHQGEWEARIAREIYESSGIHAQEKRIAPERIAHLWPAPYELHVFTSLLARPGTRQSSLS